MKLKEIDRLIAMRDTGKRISGQVFRPFLDVGEINKITLYPLFPGSKICAVSSLEQFHGWPSLTLSGPDFQLSFLYQYLFLLLPKQLVESHVGWSGLSRVNAERIDLTYQHNKDSPEVRVELLELILRYDFARVNLKLTEQSLLEVEYGKEKIEVYSEWLSLPEGLTNGEIELPTILIQ